MQVKFFFFSPQSIIEEEGGDFAPKNNSNGNDSGNGHVEDPASNWDQPLIIAEPDIQVRCLFIFYFLLNLTQCC